MDYGNLKRYGLKKAQYRPFCIWAFGETFDAKCHMYDVMLRWNNLHKDILEIKGYGRIFKDIAKMVQLWKSTLKTTKTTT